MERRHTGEQVTARERKDGIDYGNRVLNWKMVSIRATGVEDAWFSVEVQGTQLGVASSCGTRC